MTGRTVGHYQVGRLLGAGGIGEVYETRDTALGRIRHQRIKAGRTPCAYSTASRTTGPRSRDMWGSLTPK